VKNQNIVCTIVGWKVVQMARKYKIENPRDFSDEEAYLRDVTLTNDIKTVEGYCKGLENSIDGKTIDRIESKGLINESYVKLDLKKLRSIDSDPDEQQRFISSKTKFLDKNMMNIFMIELELYKDDILDDQDYKYLHALLSWSKNDLYVMPKLKFIDSVGDKRIEIYDDFVKQMLSCKERASNSSINVGVMIPNYYSRRCVSDLFNIYKRAGEDPDFVSLDFAAKRVDDSSRIGVAEEIRDHFSQRTDGNTKKDEAKRYFLYGFNVKPYNRGEPELATAFDFQTVNCSFNSIGPMHSIQKSVILPNNWYYAGRVFEEDLLYHRLSDQDSQKLYIDWVDANYEKKLSNNFDDNMGISLYNYTKRYNFERMNNKLFEVSGSLRENDDKSLKNITKTMPDSLRNIVKGNHSNNK
jgi:hypothetical protein